MNRIAQEQVVCLPYNVHIEFVYVNVFMYVLCFAFYSTARFGGDCVKSCAIILLLCNWFFKCIKNCSIQNQ